MSDHVASALQSLNAGALSAAVIGASGAGKAYQSVAQSSAIAVQDGTDYLRNVSTIAATAIGVAMAQIVASDGEHGVTALSKAQTLVGQAAQDFQQIGAAASAVLDGFPRS